MPRSTTEVVGGVANWYYAPTATPTTGLTGASGTFVAYNGVWPTGWIGNFYTQDGVTLEENKNVETWRVEEESNDINTFLDSRTMQLTMNVAQDTIDMRKLGLGGGTITTTAAGASQIGKKTLLLSDSLDAVMVGVEALNSAGFVDRWIFPNVKSVGNFGHSYRRSQYRITPVTFKIIGSVADIIHVSQTAIASA